MKKLFFPILFLVMSCAESQPKTDAPLSFQSSEFGFEYPSNWFIGDTRENESATTIKVKSRGDVVIFLLYFKDGKERNFIEFTNEFSQGAASVSNPGQATDARLSGVTLREGASIRDETFALSMLGLSKNMKRNYRMLRHNGRQLYAIAQAPAESWHIIEPGVDLIIRSLRFRN